MLKTPQTFERHQRHQALIICAICDESVFRHGLVCNNNNWCATHSAILILRRP